MIGFDPDKLVSPLMDQKKVENQSKTDNTEFRTFFQQAVGSEKTGKNDVASVAFVSDIRPAQFEAQEEPSTTMIADQVDQLVDTMETYQRQLMTHDATLKDIQPILEKIAEQSEALSAISKQTDINDNLKAIVDQSVSLSSQEIIRFNSGHYNDAN